MKKSILLLMGLFMGFSCFAQLQVSTTPQNKNGFLEEFTGIHCTYCPDGHVRAQNLKNQYGANFWIINIHVGGYATPGAGEPDFRTPFGTAISGQTGLTGYPAGTINRSVLAGSMTAGGTATGRGNWAANTGTIRSQSAYANVAVEAEVDEQSRQLRVITQYYYTAAGNGTTNKLNVALLQNDVEGPQVGASTYNPSNILANGNYVHQHMLRHLLTGQWGQDINDISMGATATDTFYYTIPAALNGVDYNLANLEVVAFIAEGQQEVINASGADVTVTNHQFNLEGSVEDISAIDDYCPGSGSESVWVKVQNNGATTITAMNMDYSVNGGTASTFNWTGSLAYGEYEYVTLPAINFTVQASNSLDVVITSVNGGTDNLTTNNTISSAFGLATETTKSNITIKITLDGYGSETSWTLKNNAGTTVQASPAYTDGTAGQSYPQPDINLTLPDDCYTFEILDSYGDGICCAYGAGGYEIWADGVLIQGMSGGTFNDDDSRKFTVNTATTAVTQLASDAFRLFPNPTENEFNVSFESTVNDALIRVVDLQGRVIISKNINNVSFHTMDVSELGTGVYMVIVNADGKTRTEKLSVVK